MRSFKKFHDYKGVFIEMTKSSHGHGGAGWEFGKCLWSPTRNIRGADTYALMREPEKGDLIFHVYEDYWDSKIIESRLCGSSTVKSPYGKIKEEPPMPGSWGGRGEYYRIDLQDYEMFEYPITFSELIRNYEDNIRKEIVENNPRFYPIS